MSILPQCYGLTIAATEACFDGKDCAQRKSWRYIFAQPSVLPDADVVQKTAERNLRRAESQYRKILSKSFVDEGLQKRIEDDFQICFKLLDERPDPRNMIPLFELAQQNVDLGDELLPFALFPRCVALAQANTEAICWDGDYNTCDPVIETNRNFWNDALISKKRELSLALGANADLSMLRVEALAAYRVLYEDPTFGDWHRSFLEQDFEVCELAGWLPE